MDKFMNYVFMVLIAGFFTAIIFYAATVFFPIDDNKCWEKYNTPAIMPKDNNYNDPLYIAEQNKIQKETEECNSVYDNNRKHQEMYKLILIGSINILVLLLLLFVFNLNTIGLGLFSGILLSSIIATASFYDSSSKIALAKIGRASCRERV